MNSIETLALAFEKREERQRINMGERRGKFFGDIRRTKKIAQGIHSRSSLSSIAESRALTSLRSIKLSQAFTTLVVIYRVLENTLRLAM